MSRTKVFGVVAIATIAMLLSFALLMVESPVEGWITSVRGNEVVAHSGMTSAEFESAFPRSQIDVSAMSSIQVEQRYYGDSLDLFVVGHFREPSGLDARNPLVDRDGFDTYEVTSSVRKLQLQGRLPDDTGELPHWLMPYQEHDIVLLEKRESADRSIGYAMFATETEEVVWSWNRQWWHPSPVVD